MAYHNHRVVGGEGLGGAGGEGRRAEGERGGKVGGEEGEGEGRGAGQLAFYIPSFRSLEFLNHLLKVLTIRFILVS